MIRDLIQHEKWLVFAYIPTCENNCVGDLDERKKSYTLPMHNMKLINLYHSFRALVTHVISYYIRFLIFINIK
jgi:hypothetical protein